MLLDFDAAPMHIDAGRMPIHIIASNTAANIATRRNGRGLVDLHRRSILCAIIAHLNIDRYRNAAAFGSREKIVKWL